MNKYRAKKVVTEDGVFDSKKEYNRWLWLKAEAEGGLITDLKRQVSFLLIPVQRVDGKVVERQVMYVADFTYYRNGEYVVEDSKGYKTDVYKIKRKLMLERHGIRIKET